MLRRIFPGTLSVIALSVLLFATFAQTAQAADDKVDQGIIATVDDKAMSFVIGQNDGGVLSLKFNDQTRYTIDGKEARWDEALKSGAKAKVTHRNGLASLVEITT